MILTEAKTDVLQLEKRAEAALRKIERITPESVKTIEELQYIFSEIKAFYDRAQNYIIQMESENRQMVQMAGVGLLVEVVAHELARSTENALAALEALRRRDVPEKIGGLLRALRSEMTSVNKRLRVLDPLSVSGRQRKEVFILGTLIDDILSGHEAQFKRHSIRLKVSQPEHIIRVRAVKGMIIQILENLLSNSLYWLELRKQHELNFRPRITIAMEIDPLRIFYSDNGKGIAKENRENIFRAFFSLKEKSKRRGLGLYIARDCAEYHGGSLVLDEKVNPETKRLYRFVLKLPDDGGGLMIELQKLLESMGITRAVIVDDVFDDTPRPDELNESDWSNFFDDIDHTTETLLSELFNDYEITSVDDLKVSEKFITILWKNRRQLDSKSVKYLFENYENTQALEFSQLNELKKKLESLRLNCSTMGRESDVNID